MRIFETLKLAGPTNGPIEILYALNAEKRKRIPESLLQPLKYLVDAGEVAGIDLDVDLQALRKCISTRAVDMSAFVKFVNLTKQRRQDEDDWIRTIPLAENMNAHALRSNSMNAPALNVRCRCGNSHKRWCPFGRCGACCAGCVVHKRQLQLRPLDFSAVPHV